MSAPKFKSLDEYLAAQDPAKAQTLRSIIDHVLTRFPELEAKISWNVPTLHRGGKYVAGVCAYKKHLTFSPWSPGIISSFQARLAAYVAFKNCFQIPIDWQMDSDLIDDLIRARLEELDAADGAH